MTDDKMLDLISSRAAASSAVEAEVNRYIAFLNRALAVPANTYNWQGRLSGPALSIDAAPASTWRPGATKESPRDLPEYTYSK